MGNYKFTLKKKKEKIQFNVNGGTVNLQQSCFACKYYKKCIGFSGFTDLTKKGL